MNKKIIYCILIVSLTLLTACYSNNAAISFKKEYESLNGKTSQNGQKQRIVSIPKNNPYEKINPKKIIDKIDNKESFYLYIGDSLCPWCRSVIEKSIEVAKKNNIEKIYYIDIWDNNGVEIFRDKYELKKDKPKKIAEGTKEYKKLLKIFDKVLSDYTLTDEDGNNIEVGEKRIYAPNFFYIKKGKIIKKIEGISEKQKDSREKLTKEIIKDEEIIFDDFFKNK